VVLVVDDEQPILRTVTMTLAMTGFTAVVAENGAAGLDSYIGLKDQICLVIADVIMPVMTGTEMVTEILKIDPEMKILLMSGYSDSVIEMDSRKRFPFIRKPFLPDDLTRKIKETLKLPDLPPQARGD
jgi:two-component system cell cycle sensor histidine kinase/response regulator CckA